MASVDKSHLRKVSFNLYGTIAGGGGGANVAIGAAVPTAKRRYIYYIKAWHDSATVQTINMFRDGAVGAVALDALYVPGYGAATFEDIGEPIVEISLNIESPTHILESGQTLGISAPAGINTYCLVACYDED